MLSLTDNAAEAARQLAADSGLEPDPGLRISAGEPTASGTPLEITLASGPHESDQTVQDGGATVYVGDDVAGFLDDKVLDAAIEGDRVRFRIGTARAA